MQEKEAVGGGWEIQKSGLTGYLSVVDDRTGIPPGTQCKIQSIDDMSLWEDISERGMEHQRQVTERELELGAEELKVPREW